MAGALDALEAAALAAVRAGVVPAPTGVALVADVVDALVVRGAGWLMPMMPDLDVARLYEAASGGRTPTLSRVVPVATSLDHGTITSVELWSDRMVARVVGPGGAIRPSHVVGAAASDDRRLDLRDSSGGVVTVGLSGGRPARESPGEVVAATVDGHLEGLVLVELARAWGSSIDELNAARRRVVAAVATLEGPARIVASFDAGAGSLAAAAVAPSLVEVTALAQRFFGGWLLSIEEWNDHWRAVVVAEPGPVRAPEPVWTALDDAGTRYGAAALDGEVLRFHPALPPRWSRLVLERHGAGEVVEIAATR